MSPTQPPPPVTEAPAPPPVIHSTKPTWNEDPTAPPDLPGMKWVAVGHLHPLSAAHHEAKNAVTIKILKQLDCPVFGLSFDPAWFWSREKAEMLGRVKLMQPHAPSDGNAPMLWNPQILINTLNYWMAPPDFLENCWVVTLPLHNASRPVEMVGRFLNWLASLPADAATARSCQAFEPPKRDLVSFDTDPPSVIEAMKYAAGKPGLTYEVTSLIQADRLLSLPGRSVCHYWVHPRPSIP
jgi:hypothetical protein